jgi:hypothetical protein
MDMYYTFYEAETEFLNIIRMNFLFQRVKQFHTE